MVKCHYFGYIRYIEFKTPQCHKPPQPLKPAHSVLTSVMASAAPEPPPIGAIAQKSNPLAPLAHSLKSALSNLPARSRLGQALQPLIGLPKMTPTEIARRRLDAFIEVHGYDFPAFSELSAILFAPETPPIAPLTFIW